MKICETCDSPIELEPNGAITLFSNCCPNCGAPNSSASNVATYGTENAINLKSMTQHQKQKLSSVMDDQSYSTMSTELLTEEVSSTESTIALLVNAESEHEMDTEADAHKPEAIQKDTLPSLEERAEASRQILSRQGFVVQEDAHGLRLSGVASRPGGLSSQLSPYDVIRLAAELEGGVIPVEQRKHCPKCDAVVNPGDKRCQWCSEIL
jgi:hypothetical protein